MLTFDYILGTVLIKVTNADGGASKIRKFQKIKHILPQKVLEIEDGSNLLQGEGM